MNDQSLNVIIVDESSEIAMSHFSSLDFPGGQKVTSGRDPGPEQDDSSLQEL